MTPCTNTQANQKMASRRRKTTTCSPSRKSRKSATDAPPLKQPAREREPCVGDLGFVSFAQVDLDHRLGTSEHLEHRREQHHGARYQPHSPCELAWFVRQRL